jgi:hypothetical protein
MQQRRRNELAAQRQRVIQVKFGFSILKLPNLNNQKML